MPVGQAARRRRLARLLRTAAIAAAVLAVCAIATVAACSRRVAAPPPTPAAVHAAVTLPEIVRQVRSVEVTVPPALKAQPAFDHERYAAAPIQSVVTDRREVALTFDDGPSSATPNFLATLASHKAHATFFVVGYRAWHFPDSVYRIVSEGNEVGSHTWSHVELKKLGPAELRMQIDRAQGMLARETGRPPLFIRPRSGKYDVQGAAAAKSRGLVMVLWSAHANDIGNILLPDQLVRNALAGVHPGSIILMHETNPNTLLALPKILAELKRKGLKPVTLSRLLADAKKPVPTTSGGPGYHHPAHPGRPGVPLVPARAVVN